MNENAIPTARAWYKAKEVLDQAKKDESELRKATMSAFFGDNPSIGTSKEAMGDKAKLVMSQSATIKVNKDKFPEFKAQLEAKGLIGDDTLIKLEPKVSLTAYKHLSDQDKILFTDLFEHGIGSPSLKVEIVKDE